MFAELLLVLSLRKEDGKIHGIYILKNMNGGGGMTKEDCLKKLEGIHIQLRELERKMEEKLEHERRTLIDVMDNESHKVENKLQYLELASKGKIQRVS